MDNDPGDSDIERTLALAVDLRVAAGRMSRRLREQAHPGDFTQSQKSVLLHLERDGPATVTTLARAEGVRPQSMGATVAGLETAGLVSGASDPADGRQTLFSLTAACREMIRANRTAREDWLFHALQKTLSPAEQDDLARAIELLKRLADS